MISHPRFVAAMLMLVVWATALCVGLVGLVMR